MIIGYERFDGGQTCLHGESAGARINFLLFTDHPVFTFGIRQGCDGIGFFAVFDGHGVCCNVLLTPPSAEGRLQLRVWFLFCVDLTLLLLLSQGDVVAKSCAEGLVWCIVKTPEFRRWQTIKGAQDATEDLKKAAVRGAMHFDTLVKSSLGEEASECGSTGIFALVTPTHYVVGNVGDSRAILVRETNKGTEMIPLSEALTHSFTHSLTHSHDLGILSPPYIRSLC